MPQPDAKERPLFFLMRHGRTENNIDNAYRGWSNSPDAQLSKDGRDDVRESALWLKRAGIKIPFILSDDLDRTKETAKIVAEILGLKDDDILLDKRLRPIDVGDFTGKSKETYPLTEYLADESKKIPGGESLGEFNKRQAKVFGDVAEAVQKAGQPFLIIGHGSNISYLHNHFNKKEKAVGYEGLVDPAGIVLFTKSGVTALKNLRGLSASNPLKDGTALSGFVTDEESRPPRSCWNCRNYVVVAKQGACTHILVQIDPQLQDRKQADGTVAVGEQDCCDNFRNAVKS